jgi:uncharacterized protein (TIGR02001 family)
MKSLTKLMSVAAVAVGSLGTASVASAEVSYNLGFASEYYFRGIYQTDASASAGIDYEQDGFYVGAWTADVGDGLEYDLYTGYGMDIGEVSVGIGFTGYYYTDDFDETYEEINLSIAYGPVSVGYSIGEYDGDFIEEPAGTTQVDDGDYGFLEVSVDLGQGFYGTYGAFYDDADGDYFEVGYGTSVSDIDVGVALIFPSDELEGDAGSDADGEAIVFSIGKSF